MNAQLINAINMIMIIALMCVIIPMLCVLMYACVYPMIMRVRVCDAMRTRTHGAVVRTPAYNATCEALVHMLMDEDDTTMCA
jgi:hypothetical protein